MPHGQTNRLRRPFVLWVVAGFLALGGAFSYGVNKQPMELSEQRTISGNIEDVWRVATDVANWPAWDPHEEAGEIYGPFEVGTKAFSKPRGGPSAKWTLTEVTKEKSWSLINPMPIGTLKVENRYTELPNGQVLCEKNMQVSGFILKTLFKLHFETETRKDMQATWIALEEHLASEMPIEEVGPKAI